MRKSSVKISAIATVFTFVILAASTMTAVAIPMPVPVKGVVQYENGTMVPDGWTVSLENQDEDYPGFEPWTTTTDSVLAPFNYFFQGTAENTSTFEITASDPTGTFTGSETFTADPMKMKIINITVSADTTPPTTTVTPNVTVLPGNVTEWVNRPVMLSFRRVDNGSGVNHTNLSAAPSVTVSISNVTAGVYANNTELNATGFLVNSSFGEYFNVTISEKCNATIEYYSVDNAGNNEALKNLTVRIDTTPPTVTVTSPNRGESWSVGSSHAITWTASDNVGVTSIDIYYSTDGGATYPYTIAIGEANDGTYTWTVQATPSTTCRVKVVAHDAADNTGDDTSNENFTIKEAPVTRTLILSANPSTVAPGNVSEITAMVMEDGTPVAASINVTFKTDFGNFTESRANTCTVETNERGIAIAHFYADTEGPANITATEPTGASNNTQVIVASLLPRTVEVWAEPPTVAPGNISTIFAKVMEDGTPVKDISVEFETDFGNFTESRSTTYTNTTNESGIAIAHFVSYVNGTANITATEPNGTYNSTTVIVMTPIIKYNLAITSTEGGNVTEPGEGTHTYDAGTVVNLTAVADAGYEFVNWTGEVSTIADVNASETNITMNDNYTITANFKPITYTLTIRSTDGGNVTELGEGTHTYDAGTVVNLTAVADAGYEFVNWTGEVSTIADVNASETNITMNDNYTITANFKPITYTLTIRSTDGGNVTEPSEGTHTYDAGTVVNLTAVADAGYEFVNWTGEVSTIADVNASETNITMNGDYAITANFKEVARIPGDVNGDREINIQDAVLLFNWVSFPSEQGTTYVLTKPENANVNGDTEINIQDAVLLFNWVSFPSERGTTYILQ